MQHKMCLCQQQARIRDTRTTRSESKQSPARKDGIEMNEEQVPPNKRTTSRLSRELPGDGNVVILHGSFVLSRD